MKKNLLLSFLLVASFLSGFSQPGSLDMSFGSSGVVSKFMGFAYYNVKLQTDGKLVTVGNQTNADEDFFIARYKTDGSPDSTFGLNGFVSHDLGQGAGTDEYAYSVAVQNDGKILVGGEYDDADAEYVVARYLANGTPDSTFGTNGISILTKSLEQYAYSIIIQPNGKILIGGEEYDGSSEYNICIARLNSNGAIDSTFGVAGFAVHSRSALDDDCYAIALQPDGKIVTGGEGDEGGAYYNFFMSRIDSNGVLDSLFGTNGFVSTDLGDYGVGYSVSIQPDGKILLGGGHTNSNGDDEVTLIRYKTDGSLDSAFGTNGVTNFPAPAGEYSYISSLVLQPNNKIIAGGYGGSNAADMAFYRFHPDGSIDQTFGLAGAATVDLGADDYGFSCVIQPDGKVVMAGVMGDTAVLVRINGGEVVSVTPDKSLHTKRVIVYPNPSAGNANISLELTSACEVEYSITDISGRILLQQNQGMLNEGTHLIELNPSRGLPSGTYFIRLQTGSETQVFKWVIQN